MITDSYSEAEKFNTALDAENYELAGTLLRAGLEKNPDDFVWLTAAGNLHFTQRHYERAESFYRRALSLEPQDSTALCNLAGVLYETGRYDEALILAENALQIEPDCVTALLHKGNVLNALEKTDEALICYETVIGVEPQNALALFNKASVFMKKQSFEQARDIYADLHRQFPESVDYLAALASALEQNEQFVQAAQTYIDLLKIQSLPAWHITLGGALYGLHASGREDEALRLLDDWLSAFPDNPFARHTLETFSNNPQSNRVPQDYVTQLFDTFAESFDSVLSDLNYTAPEHVAQKVREFCEKTADVLDLGCGTGLCGQALKKQNVPFSSLTGVDLSEKMLEKAKERGVYTTLEQADILSYPPQCANRFDTVVSSDVFTYLGALDVLFKGISLLLKPNGVLIFTISENKENNADFRLTPSGRYVHSRHYLRRTLSEANLTVFNEEKVVLRYEMGQPVEGFVIAARQKS